jgi:hypothetical protein
MAASAGCTGVRFVVVRPLLYGVAMMRFPSGSALAS